MIKALTVLILIAVPPAAQAFATAGAEGGGSGDFKAGVKAVRREDFARAAEIFARIVARDQANADAFNYLAFSQRNLGRGEEAMANYGRALALNPRHKGALEYQGELFLKLGDRARAEANLAALVAVCGRRCAERDALQAAIERAKDGKAVWLGPR